jgi:hypothetical protein
MGPEQLAAGRATIAERGTAAGFAFGAKCSSAATLPKPCAKPNAVFEQALRQVAAEANDASRR